MNIDLRDISAKMIEEIEKCKKDFGLKVNSKALENMINSYSYNKQTISQKSEEIRRLQGLNNEADRKIRELEKKIKNFRNAFKDLKIT